MAPHVYHKYPEFAGLDTYVWDYLNGLGKSIPDIMKNHSTTYLGTRANRPIKNNPVWHNKTDLDKYVAEKLNIDPMDYPGNRTNNPFYNAVVTEIRKLRVKGILIDWDKTSSNHGIGIWKLDKQKLENFVEEYVEDEIKNNNFFASGEKQTIYVRKKHLAFHKILVNQYKHCLFCGLELNRYLQGTHIVPYSYMRISEPENAMNPSNGLLLCQLCDAAFGRYDILLENDYGIKISNRLQDNRDKVVKRWIESIPSQIKIDEDTPYKPDVRYIELKKKLRS